VADARVRMREEKRDKKKGALKRKAAKIRNTGP